MYISYNWLKDFVKIPAKIKPREIAEKLTNHTVEVEDVVDQAEQFKGVVVGKVLEVNQHPNADRLKLTVIDIKKEKLNIVCGANNIKPGQLVAVALVGTILPNELEIKEAEIRGEKSCGMVCAEDELGLGKDHEGILVLDERAKIGEPFAKYLGAHDIILEVDNKSLSNRPDLWSHYGLARELAVIFNLNLKPYDKLIDRHFEFLEDKENKLEIKVEDKELCPRYMAVKIDNIEVKESPDWLKERLIAVGQRPINNIVDLTNYVMLEFGQPLHTFNSGKINKIIVRLAHKNEIIETLDEKERNLSEEDLLITDGKIPLAIAGVMGGKNSEINVDTKSLILEAANFQAINIRRSSQRLGLRTESSMRFEKSLDSNMTEIALFRFLTLLKEFCPKLKVNSSLVDINNSILKKEPVEFDFDWLTNKIGQEIPRDQVIDILEKLGFNLENKEDKTWQVIIPSWRAGKDVTTKEDLAEEILRIYGYDNITSQLPVITMTLPEVNQERLLERKIKNILSLKYSLTEAYNYSFVGEEQLKKLNIDFFNYLKIANPLADNQTLLRQTLFANLLMDIKNNQFKADELSFFEIGSVYFSAAGNLQKDNTSEDSLPYQEKHLGLIIASENYDLFDRLKGIINNLMQTIINYEVEVNFSVIENIPGWANSETIAKISILNQELGIVAVVSQEIITNLNIKKSVVAAEINFSKLAGLIFNLPPFRFKEIAKYPPVIRDLAFVIPEEILYNDLKEELIEFNPLIKSVELFDVYQGNKLSDDKKSLAFHIFYQSDDKTLITEEVDQIQNDLIAHLAKKFEAQLRNF